MEVEQRPRPRTAGRAAPSSGVELLTKVANFVLEVVYPKFFEWANGFQMFARQRLLLLPGGGLELGLQEGHPAVTSEGKAWVALASLADAFVARIIGPVSLDREHRCSWRRRPPPRRR